MRALILSTIVVGSVTTVTAMAGESFAAGPSKIVMAPVTKVYVPVGFDSNDNSELVIQGEFPNSCYRTGPSTAVVDSAAKTITVEAKAYLAQQAACLEFKVPYIQSVKLGLLDAASYRIIVKQQPKASDAPLLVETARSPSQDEALYAPVEVADLVKDDQGRDSLRVEGQWPLMFVGCMVMKEVEIAQTSGSVLIVRPKAMIVDDGPACDNQKRSQKFSIETQLPANLKDGNYLIHSRSLNGNSVNRFVAFKAEHPVN